MPDLRLIAFCIGLCLTLARGPELRGVGTFLRVDFLVRDSAVSLSDSSASISTSALGSRGEVAFELGAVLGFV